MTSPKVCIIILNWNGLEDTIECLESLKKITYLNYEVVVVDNGSEGNDGQVLKDRFSDYIHLIENDRNYGYTGGNNIGIRYALSNSDPDYLLILNNDVIVAPDFLNHLVDAAEADASIGIVGPKVYYYAFPQRLQTAGAKVNMWTGQVFPIGSRQIDVGQYDRQREIDYVFGCCLLAKKEVIQKVGLFDESYFCYYDETDYCTRARKASYKVCYIPEAKIWHKNPIKEKVWNRTPARRRKTDFSYYYMARNNFRFMRKHATRWQYSSFLTCFFGYQFWFTIGVCILYHRDIGRLTGFYHGVRDGLLDRDGPKI